MIIPLIAGKKDIEFVKFSPWQQARDQYLLKLISIPIPNFLVQGTSCFDIPRHSKILWTFEKCTMLEIPKNETFQ